MSAGTGHDRSEMMRRLRLGNLHKLFRDRYGPTLPNDDAGRADLRELLLPISLAPNAAIKTPKVIEVWAPWMKSDEATELIDEINRLPIRHRKPTAREVGERQNLINHDRERLKLWTIAACDMSPKQVLEWRKAKAKARMRELRQRRGSKSRAKYEATSLSRTKPWLTLGISRRTWERRRVASPCAVKLSIAANALATPEQAAPRKSLPRLIGPLSQTVKLQRRLRNRRTRGQTRLPDVTDREIGERTCDIVRDQEVTTTIIAMM